jgi:MoxR-like ATPase
MEIRQVSDLSQAILDEVDHAVVGKREALTLVLAGVLAGGHVLLEDFPGLGKTLAARSFAQTLGLEFKRAQFTPDLLPGDITGSFVYDQRSHEFEFRAGPLFAGLLLADEINRTPPKTQAALLEAMQEKQVTVEGRTFPLPRPFHVLATANPVEYEGTYPLPEAQLDRFLMRVSFGYPTLDEEWQILSNRMARQREEQQLRGIVTAERLLEMQATIEATPVEESIGRYCVATRRAGPAAVLPGVCRHRRSRLRGPRGRQGGRQGGPRTPHHRQAGAVDEQHQRCGSRRQPAAYGAHALGPRAPAAGHGALNGRAPRPAPDECPPARRLGSDRRAPARDPAACRRGTGGGARPQARPAGARGAAGRGRPLGTGAPADR